MKGYDFKLFLAFALSALLIGCAGMGAFEYENPDTGNKVKVDGKNVDIETKDGKKLKYKAPAECRTCHAVGLQ